MIREIDKLLALWDSAAERWEGNFDATEDIRQMRRERDEQIGAFHTDKFLQTEFGQYILEEADANISIEKVRSALAKIKGSLSQDIIAERKER